MFPCTPPHLSYPTLLAFTCVGSSTLLISSWVGWVGGVGCDVNVHVHVHTCHMLRYWFLLVSALLLYLSLLGVGGLGGWGGFHVHIHVHTCHMLCYWLLLVCSSTLLYLFLGWGGMLAFMYTSTLVTCYATSFYLCLLFYVTYLFLGWGGWGVGGGMLTFIYTSRLVTWSHGRKQEKCQADDVPTSF